MELVKFTPERAVLRRRAGRKKAAGTACPTNWVVRRLLIANLVAVLSVNLGMPIQRRTA
jgi:hypothetical protein